MILICEGKVLEDEKIGLRCNFSQTKMSTPMGSSTDVLSLWNLEIFSLFYLPFQPLVNLAAARCGFSDFREVFRFYGGNT